ncbi:MAG: CDP-diacylglycerol--serine O-phosphatidyltransferase [Deltaproteobacteria bacterium]|nr:CDP-diacylglycerol--serine O-phosphatidyltransferase [Deltaproteobacteria bacterium]
MKKGIYLLPNLLTTANLFCGFFAITRAFVGQFELACWFVILATFFDFLDGRVARMTNSQSEFGVEYDSLSDLTTFCLAPAAIAFSFGLKDFGKLGIAAAFVYFACGALRLARFNVQQGSVEKFDFQGLPSPAAGGTLVSYVIFSLELFGPSEEPYPFVLLALTPLLGLLMVSNIRYKSFKKHNRTSFLFLVFIVSTIGLLAMYPQVMFFVFGIGYISVGLGMWIWQSPQKIRNIKDLWIRIYNERREVLVYEDDDDEDESQSTALNVIDQVDELAQKRSSKGSES